jgi:hypothetical protein
MMVVKSKPTTAVKRGSTDEVRVATNVATMLAASTDAADAAKARAPASLESYCTAWRKCHDLGKQLSEALAETGDEQFAYIRPAGVEYAVGFGAKSDGITARFVEMPVDRVKKIAAHLAFALDDWREDGAPEFIAHVYPASSGRGMWFEVSRQASDEQSLTELINRCEKALSKWDASHEVLSADVPVNLEINASRKALLAYKPISLPGMHRKAAAMLKLRVTGEWDDFDRSDLIRAFTACEEVQS